MNLWMFLARAGRRYPDVTAVIDDCSRQTYRELAGRTDMLAAGLAALGVRPGDHAGILLRNSGRYIELLFALLKLGAVCVPLNWRLTGADIRQCANHADLDFLFFEQALEGLAPLGLERLRLALCLDEQTPSGMHAHESIIAGAPAPFPQHPTAPGDPAAIIYTAGTTDSPRGVVLTHANFLWNTVNYSHAYAITPQDRELAPAPLFHSSTFGRVFTYVYNAATCVLCSSFDPEHALELIAREGITSLTQAPAMYRMMSQARRTRAYDMASVRRAVSGASVLTPQVRKEIQELFPRAATYDLYGITEAAPGVSILNPDNFMAAPDSVGRPLLTVQIAIADNEGLVLPRGQQGEILVRGPNVTKGYYKNPAATAQALSKGWLHTGDFGLIDAAGYVYISGRKKDLIISGGINIYPGEIESVLEQHPAVAEAAVCGMPDGLWGEQVAAAIVLRQNRECSQQDLASFCRERLAGYKCPKSFFFIQALPRNAAQKVLKAELVKQFT
jgi:acyl-CoA synthetase (AMP-forming)/AMP-acid ligase II